MSVILRPSDFSVYFVVHPFDSPLAYIPYVNPSPNKRFLALRLSTRSTMKMNLQWSRISKRKACGKTKRLGGIWTF